MSALRTAAADTSLEAYRRIMSHVSRLARQVFKHVHSLGFDGATCEECEVALRMKHQTCSARIRELRDAGLLRDSGRRRLTSSKSPAMVLVVADVHHRTGCDHARAKWIDGPVVGKRIRTACECGKFLGYRWDK